MICSCSVLVSEILEVQLKNVAVINPKNSLVQCVLYVRHIQYDLMTHGSSLLFVPITLPLLSLLSVSPSLIWSSLLWTPFLIPPANLAPCGWPKVPDPKWLTCRKVWVFSLTDVVEPERGCEPHCGPGTGRRKPGGRVDVAPVSTGKTDHCNTNKLLGYQPTGLFWQGSAVFMFNSELWNV